MRSLSARNLSYSHHAQCWVRKRGALSQGRSSLATRRGRANFQQKIMRDGGRRREKNVRKFFGFCTRESASVSEARIILYQGSIQNTFELRSIHTAIFRKGFLNANLGRAEGATLMHSPRRIQNPKGFSTLRVAQKVRFDP